MEKEQNKMTFIEPLSCARDLTWQQCSVRRVITYIGSHESVEASEVKWFIHHHRACKWWMQDSNPVSVVSKAGYFSHPQGSSSEVSQGVLQLVPVFRQAVLEKSNFTEDLSWGGGGSLCFKNNWSFSSINKELTWSILINGKDLSLA